MKENLRIAFGGIFGALSVALGAFGAHALKPMLVATDRLSTYETASQYMMYHALALIITGLFPAHGILKISGWLFVIGILLFSGSLYIICFTGIRAWGAVAPFGGISFILGWLSLTIYGFNLYKYRHQH